ncbi:hypothetical protein Psal006b_02909 [Piscirickettsia salmonis]|uniref:Multidrug transporter n=1 Tax=Piscirickettsia salmonis TaxID=1238 RepID=A0A1L6TGF0_PISSA|nr:hypothetical protein [Piscirickettsia salmonis]AKP72877.1 hypothetical protein PSLF89_791 [Piscirickettsia salmonis LF-89 = ATCC VR-1361]ALB21497.1 multidrug transporter [Piscirickettsia salmonis]ALY01717.1 hypothetical protein AWE47_01555 [Piscirickettsia salmonis]AMA41233.1 hypothetical protein AWJ11_01565 [Piscirickettsia salmonis]AOS36422.1 hypothetical protein AVM72_14550 [Piscirickettsia salmonis]
MSYELAIRKFKEAGVNYTDAEAQGKLKHDTHLQDTVIAIAELEGLTYQSWRHLHANQQAQAFYQSLHRSIGIPLPKKNLAKLNNRKNHETLAQYQRAACALADKFTYDLDSPKTQQWVRAAWQRIQTDPTFATAVTVLAENKILSLENLITIEQETEETALLVRAIAAFDDRGRFFPPKTLKVNTDRFTDLQTANPLPFSDPSQPFSRSGYWRREVWFRIHDQKDSAKYQKLACILDDSKALTLTAWDAMKDSRQYQGYINLLHDNGLLPLSKTVETVGAEEQTELLTAVRHLHQEGILPDNLYQAQLAIITLAMDKQSPPVSGLTQAMQSENPVQSIAANSDLMNAAAQRLIHSALDQAQELQSSESSTDKNKALLAASLERKFNRHELTTEQTVKSLARVLSRREGWFKYRRYLEKDGSDMPEPYNRGKLKIEAARDLLKIPAPKWDQALRCGEDKGKNPAYQTYNNLLKLVTQEDKEKPASRKATRTTLAEPTA